MSEIEKKKRRFYAYKGIVTTAVKALAKTFDLAKEQTVLSDTMRATLASGLSNVSAKIHQAQQTLEDLLITNAEEDIDSTELEKSLTQ